MQDKNFLIKNLSNIIFFILVVEFRGAEIDCSRFSKNFEFQFSSLAHSAWNTNFSTCPIEMEVEIKCLIAKSLN